MSDVQVVVVGTQAGGRGGIGQSLPTVIARLRERGALGGVLTTHRAEPRQRVVPALSAMAQLPLRIAAIRRHGDHPVIWAHIGGPLCVARTTPLMRLAKALGATVWAHLHSAALDPWTLGPRTMALRAALAPVDHVFLPTEHAADRYRAAGLRGVHPWAPALPPAVLDALEQPPVLSRRRASLHLLTASRLVPGKGLHTLIDAVALGPHRLSIAGDGPLRDTLRAYVDQLGLADRVVFLGWVDDLQHALDSADVFVLPSTHDTYGLAVAHALAAGVPCVVADTPVVDEVWGPAATAVPVDPTAVADAIDTHQTGRREASNTGRRHIQALAERWEHDLVRHLGGA